MKGHARRLQQALCVVAALTLGLVVIPVVLEARQASLLRPVPAPPPQRAELVELGRLLFFDERLSGDNALACAYCHQPEQGWGDGQPLSEGYPGSPYFRNAPTLMNVLFQKQLYWDGRLAGADLPTQVRDALTEAHFMNADGRLLQERLKQVPEYVAMFERAFGKGDPSFGRILKAIAAFERTLVSRNVPFDRYLKGDQTALIDPAKHGLALFTGKASCIRCHNGPLLSDGSYHALGVPENPQIIEEPERHITLRRFNRSLGVPNAVNIREDIGRYAVTKARTDWKAFRTPTLRELKYTAPYMHNGTLATLADVVEFYNQGGGSATPKSPLLKSLRLTEDEKRALVAFLESLSGDPIVIEWPEELPDYEVRPFGKN
ncbi:MAG: cytochrome-c peroxidase [Candidatus Methylomirabilales bacterium]